MAMQLGRKAEVETILAQLREVNPLGYFEAERARAIAEERYKDAEALDEKIDECKVSNWLRRKAERTGEDVS